jgi:2'-5' RNA ligase
MLRTFIAVEISEAVRKKAGELIRALKSAEADVKWVEPHNQHLTLQFLGDIAEDRIPGICQAVERGASGVKPFALEIAGAGAFPNVHRPRTIWLGAKQGTEKMAELHEKVASALAAMGIQDEDRRFQSHLTLGRVRGPRNLSVLGDLLRQHADFQAGETTVDRVTVFSSRLQSGGPVYTPLAKVVLQGGSGGDAS